MFSDETGTLFLDFSDGTWWVGAELSSPTHTKIKHWLRVWAAMEIHLMAAGAHEVFALVSPGKRLNFSTLFGFVPTGIFKQDLEVIRKGLA